MPKELYGDRWKIIESLAEGGQGQVFKVCDTKNENRICVLKRLKNINRIERFKGEIDTIKKLDHKNIVKLVDFNLEGKKPYLVTEFCVGGELTFDKISGRSSKERLQLFSAICKAVGYAHEKGVVHRDIKPANILFEEDEKTPVVTDFGICFNTDDGLERLTETLEQAGARFYMAPELANGRADEITPRCDIYSLGKLLYWIFKGRIFDRENFIYDNDKDLRKFSDADESMHFVYEIFEKTIKYNPDDRFSHANELSTEVDKIISVLHNNGRFLDANISSKCMFCVVGKYSKKIILPVINKQPSSPYGQQVQNYQLNYNQSFFHILSGREVSLPEGNITQGLYQKYLILACDHCGNCQLLNIGSEGSQNWRNVEPEIR